MFLQPSEAWLLLNL
ncbi:hypothetical protein STRIP9103_00913, partial [Streptomyces ipomoeae 91-03]